MKRTTTDLGLLKIFYQYLKPQIFWVRLGIFAIPFSTIATILVPWFIVVIVDDYLIPRRSEGLHLMVYLFMASVVLTYLFDALYSFSMQRAGQHAIYSMRNRLFSHSLTLPRSYFDNTPIGVTLSRITSDMESIGESLAIGVLGLITDIIKTIALFGFLVYLSWELTLVVMILFPVLYYVVAKLRTQLRNHFTKARASLASATAYLAEALSGIKTIQLFAAEDRALRHFKGKNEKFLHAQTKANLYDAVLFSVIEGLTTVAMVLIIWYGAGQVVQETITLGILIGFINTLARIFIPIREFAQQISQIQRSLSALEHADSLLQQESEGQHQDETNQLGPFDEIIFQDVHFQYNPEGQQVLKGISFTLSKGQRIAIVGATGSGKSTILRLITRAYQGYQGSITINGQELSSISRKELLHKTSLMQQDVYLFNETLLFNIGLNRPEITEDHILDAAKFVYAHDFIESFEEGYCYQVKDNGKNLSAGQAQLISFARAIASNSELILLDEATSSVDSITEDLIQKATEKIFTHKTVIAIAHRLSTIQHSDLILVMKEGQIVERGNHQELIAQNGYYQSLLEQLKKEQE